MRVTDIMLFQRLDMDINMINHARDVSGRITFDRYAHCQMTAKRPNNFKIFGTEKTRNLNSIHTIGYDHIYLQEITLNFTTNSIL